RPGRAMPSTMSMAPRPAVSGRNSRRAAPATSIFSPAPGRSTTTSSSRRHRRTRKDNPAMRRLLTACVTLFAVIAVTIPTLAQTPAPSPESMTGLREGVTRIYAPDPETVPSENPEAFVQISLPRFRFDTADHAADAWSRLTEHAPTLITGPGDAKSTPEVHQDVVDDLGTQASVVWFAATSSDDGARDYRSINVQDGPYLIIATAMGGARGDVR